MIFPLESYNNDEGCVHGIIKYNPEKVAVIISPQ